MSDTPPPAEGWRQGPDGLWYGPGQTPPPPGDPGVPPPIRSRLGNIGRGNRLLWLGVALVLVAALAQALLSDDEPEEAAASKQTEVTAEGPDDIEEAFFFCADHVKSRLKAPATADFPNPYRDDAPVTIQRLRDSRYRVVSVVDAQNSFGANIRTGFVCEARYLGNGRWRLADLYLDG